MIVSQTCTPYYTGTTGNALMGLSTIYTTIAHFSSIFLKLTPFGVRQSPLDPSDCFSVPSSVSSSSSSNKHVAIVTGSNTGIGYETSLALVQRGYDVILACRSRSKGESAASSINKHIQTMNTMNDKTKFGKAIFLQPVDLTSFQSVRSFTEVFSNHYQSLNILVNNAGLNSSGNGVSLDNLDIVFQANSLGHFLLTKLLLPQLISAKNVYLDKNGGENVEAGRIVNLSSTMHHFCNPSYKTNKSLQQMEFWEDCSKPNFSDNTYTESKLAAILFSMELNKRYGSKGIRSISANPGAVNSDIWRDIPQFLQKFIVRPLFSIFFLTTKQGARTSVAGAVGKLPPNAIYLQPYWLPFSQSESLQKGVKNLSFARRYALAFPMFEFMGPYIGHAVTEPRLLSCKDDRIACAEAFWNACEKITAE